MTECSWCSRISDGIGILGENGQAVALRETGSGPALRAVVVARQHGPGFFALTEAEQLAILRLADEVGRDLAGTDPLAAFTVEIVAGAAVGHARAAVIVVRADESTEAVVDTERSAPSIRQRCQAAGVDYARLSRLYSDAELERLLSAQDPNPRV